MKEFYAGKRVLVTGAAGFIGSAICAQLKEYGALLTPLDRETPIEDLWELAKVVKHVSPEIVFHLAAQTEVRKSHVDPATTFRTNALGTFNVLETCRRHAKGSLQALVVASSDKAYGHVPQDQLPYREDSPLACAGDFYAATKAVADDLCHHYARLYDMPIRVLRCANVYGPGQKNETTLITNTIKKILRGERPTIYQSSANVKREWLYITDAVNVYLRTAIATTVIKKDWESGIRGCRALNVGSGEVANPIKIVQMILLRMGTDIRADVVEDEKLPEIGDQRLNINRLLTTFPDWKPTLLDEGLRETINWYKEQK